MSQQQPRPDAAPAEQIDDFQSLDVTQVGFGQYLVSNRASGHVYRVQPGKPACDCENFHYEKDAGGGEACKHIQYVVYKDPESLSFEEQATQQWTSMMSDAREAAELATDAATALEDGLTEVRTQEAHEAQESEDRSTEDRSHGPTADQVREWVSENHPASDLVTVRAGSHGKKSGIIVDPENQEMTDTQYETFKSMMNSLDDTEVHVGFTQDPCHECGKQDDEFYYFVPASDSSEVWR